MVGIFGRYTRLEGTPFSDNKTLKLFGENSSHSLSVSYIIPDNMIHIQNARRPMPLRSDLLVFV